jgi:hypothetical protein
MTSPVPDERPAPLDSGAAVAAARTQLQRLRDTLSETTGGAPPRAVLAELAQGLAAELAAHFEELPMQTFTGWVPRAAGAWGWMLPPRRVPHRVVLGRYLSVTVPQATGQGYTACAARIALVALGADGVLRRGELWEGIVLPVDTSTTLDALPWDDARLRRVPSRSLRLVPWDAGATNVATPLEVLDAVTRIASSAADVAQRELALLNRLLGDGNR